MVPRPSRSNLHSLITEPSAQLIRVFTIFADVQFVVKGQIMSTVLSTA